MTPHAMKSGGSQEYGTPPELFNFLNRRFLFDYDPFAALDNAMPTEWVSTIEGTYHMGPHGALLNVSYRDGFNFPWDNRRVFFNPPYKPTGILARTVEKAIEERERAEIIVGIFPVDTSVAWWHRLRQFAHLEPLVGRPAFIDKATGLPRKGSTVPIVVAQFYPPLDAWRR